MSAINVTRTQQRPVLGDHNQTRRVGLLALATDLISEGDLNTIFTPIEMAMHVTRVPFANPTTPENLIKMLPHLTDATQLLVPGIKLEAICFSCTSASAVIGDAVVTEAIQKARPGVPVVTPSASARLALEALGVNRVSVLTPYEKTTSQVMADYFARSGLDVLQLHYMDIEDDQDMARVTDQAIIDAAIAADLPEAEAMFISCTGLPAAGVAAAIEKRIGKPVVTSNQASGWVMTRLAGFDNYQPEEWGSLFTKPLPTALAGVA